MHVAITILTILASIKWGDWKNWRKYHASMYFITTGGLLYEFIVKKYSLWKFHSDFFYGHNMTVIVYAVITMPISILIFLSHFPETGGGRRFLYILMWSGIYFLFEWILFITGRISYANGWKFGYSFLFDIVMFSVIAIHQNYPIRAYFLSVFIIIFLITAFHVPFQWTK